jgi:hypothetical protein
MYQYMSEDMSTLKRFKIVNNPFSSSPAQERPVLRKYPKPVPVLPPQPAGQKPAQPVSSLGLIKPSADIKDIASTPLIPEHPNRGELAATDNLGSNYPKAPQGFAMQVTRHFVVYEEGSEVSSELTETLESLHGNIMLDLVAFSPWTRENKVYIYYSQSPKTYRRLTGRPEWSGGTASLSERKIYVYRSDEAMGIMAHELTHIYFDSFFPADHPSPLWLSEGLATYVQSERGLSKPNWLEENLKLIEGGSGFKLGDLVRIESMQGADEDNVRLWYAQSYSLVRFLIKLKIGESFYIFCKELRDGRPPHQALYRAYGMPYNKLSSLEYAWRYDLKTGKISGIQKQ